MAEIGVAVFRADAHPLDRSDAGNAALRGGALRMSAYVGGILLALISVPLLVRHLGIDAFGQYAAVLALVTIVSGLTEAGLNAIAVREYATIPAEHRQELMANLLLEDSDEAKAFAEADAALQISPEALDALAIHAAIEVLNDRSPDAWLEKIRQVNPVYGEGYALIANLLVINRRYEDGIAYYRKAIEADPRLWSAHSQLGINLMRLGQDRPDRVGHLGRLLLGDDAAID